MCSAQLPQQPGRAVCELKLRLDKDHPAHLVTLLTWKGVEDGWMGVYNQMNRDLLFLLLLLLINAYCLLGCGGDDRQTLKDLP